MTAAPLAEPIASLEAVGIVKAFPGVLANDHVDFELRTGEIHALLGENGAGKSTLMNILAGLYRPDEGEIRLDGRPVSFGSPRDAIEAGVGMVHQHFTLVPSQSVTENILLGLKEPRFLLDPPRFEAEVARLAAEFGLRVHPRAKVWQLSVGEQQRVEILKLLYRGARILILDEPTAVLAPQEAEDLFRTLRAMADAGQSVVFISHKLNEVVAIADRVTVMRRGRVTAAAQSAEGVTKRDLARLMVGRDLFGLYEKTPYKPGEVLLTATDVEADNDRGLPALRGVSLEVRAGEIVGIAAVAGNGQTELAEVITGLRPCAGTIRIGSQTVSNRPPSHAIRAGVAHVPEDRTGVGSAPNLSVADNLIMKRFREPPVSRGWLIDDGRKRTLAEDLKEQYAISAPSVETRARLLSGGNLQRLILAREIETAPSLMVAVQPTRGLDVGAIETVHRLLLDRRERGAGILLISEELDEILELADRVDVMYEGRIVGSFDAETADVHEIGLLMTGATRAGRRVGSIRATAGGARPPRAGGPVVTVRLEPRLTVARWLSPLATVLALLAALVISGVVIAFVGGDPVRSYAHILNAAFGSVGVISDTLVKATPLLLTGLACTLAFRMRLWNIGAEGQLLLGAWGASAVVLAPLLPAGTPGYVLIPAMMLAGAAAGAAWGLIPGLLRALLGVNEIIVTLMLNYIALFWIQFWVFGPWSEGGFQQSEAFPPEAFLPRLTDFASSVPAFGGLTVHLGFLFGVGAAVIVWLVLERSRWGYEIRLAGDNPEAARYAGVDIKRLIIVVFAASGALAGLAGMSEVSGSVHRLQDRFSPGYGYTAIIIAYLARFDPLRVIVASILFGALILAGREIQPSGVPAMIQGVILFCLIVAEVFVRYRVRIERTGAGRAAT